MKHIVMLSGGIGSWATAKRVTAKYGTENLLLVFADTLSEDDDLYRFVIEGSASVFGIKVDIPFSLPSIRQREERKAAIVKLSQKAATFIPGLVWLIEGRDIWDVFRDKKFLGNSSVDPCSLVLKRQYLRGWVRANFVPRVQTLIEQKGITPHSRSGIAEAIRIGESVVNKVRSLIKAKQFEEAKAAAESLLNMEREVANQLTFYIGYDWTEVARWDRAKKYWEPYQVECPLVDPPFLHKSDLIQELLNEGIQIPLLYRLNMPHNNCWGRCVKAGHAQWYRLLEVLPDVYALSEEMEQEWQECTNSNKTILKDRRGGESKPFSLKEFRLQWESYPEEKKQKIRNAWTRNFGVLPEELLNELQVTGIDLADTSGCGCFSGV